MNERSQEYATGRDAVKVRKAAEVGKDSGVYLPMHR
jgi:hypothetical protein